MLHSFKTKVSRNLSNLPGWRTNRKILAIESDDWGSIRMPSIAAFKAAKDSGIDIEGSDAKRYNLYDTLANKDDLSAMFQVLSAFQDKSGRPAVFTALSVMANPDFKKIRESNFKEYYYEPFIKTLENYYGDDTPIELWKKGIADQVFIPQFHAREHLNIGEWMRALQSGNKDAIAAFNLGFWGFKNESPISYQAAFDLFDPKDLTFQESVIKDGLVLFENIFGYKASYFVPPNGPFNNTLEKVAAEGGIKYMYASKMQLEPLSNGKTRKVIHWMGQRNQYNQTYLTRNCFFEPSQEGKDWVNECLDNISIAFRWQKPAVISSHRVNYIGALYPENREKGLKQLSKLLNSILQKWPDVEFCTSAELGDMIVASRK